MLITGEKGNKCSMNEAFYNTNLLYYEIPSPVKKALAVFATHGYRAYIVGGAVRDIIRGAEVHDWDITTETEPMMTKQLFSEYPTYDIGIKHGTVTVNIDGEMIEITTFRTDGEYVDSRHPVGVTFTNSLYEDLKRRDFTMNAIAMNVCKDIDDPFMGMKDIASNVIRTVGNPIERFSEDALRIMRAFRFSAVLLYDIEEKTLNAAAICSSKLRQISRERINDEWKKLLMAQFCSKTLILMKRYGIFSAIFPDLKVEIEDLSKIERLKPIYVLRSAAFFKNSPIEEISKNAERINFTKAEMADVKAIIEAYRSIVVDHGQDLRRFCFKYRKNAEYAAMIAEADLLIPADILPVVRAILADPVMIWDRKELKINGKDLIQRFEIEPRRLSSVIDELLVRVVDQKCENESEALLIEVEKIIK